MRKKQGQEEYLRKKEKGWEWGHLWINGKDERREHGGDSDGESGQTRELLHEGSTTLYGGDPGF